MLVKPAVILCIAFLLLLGFVASRRTNRRQPLIVVAGP